MDEAQAETQLQLGEVVHFRRIEERRDRHGTIVLQVQAVLLRRRKDRRQPERTLGDRPIGGPERPLCRSS